MEYLFSYGTLQLPDVQRETFGETVEGEADALVGYRTEMLRIEDPDVVALSGAAEHPVAKRTDNPEDRIPGTVFALTLKQIARADAYEVDDYHRVSVTLASGKTAWLYEAKPASPR